MSSRVRPESEQFHSRPPLERMLRIHQALHSGSYPNATTLARQLEVSTKSIHRDLEFMRDRLELPALTERERAILTAVASGMTTAAISRELWISQHTVKFHLTNIYRKIGVSNRAGAVRYALQHGVAA